MAMRRHVEGLLRELGETDCELLGDGWLAQPANAISSLSYVLIGIAITIGVARSKGVRSGSLVYAGCLVAVGAGSVAFHGPQLSGSQLMHDLPILLTVLFMLNHDRLVLLPETGRELSTFAGGALVALGLALAIPVVIAPLTVGVAVLVLIVEVVIHRRHLRPITGERQRRGPIAFAVVAGVGGASWLLGRSNSPLCEPDSVFQLHGLWHMLSAAVFALWYWWAMVDDQR